MCGAPCFGVSPAGLFAVFARASSPAAGMWPNRGKASPSPFGWYTTALRYAAARRIHNALPEARFSIHGEPLFSKTAAHYAALVRSRAHGIPVEFAGWSDDIASVLAGLDLLLVPSAPGEATTRVIPEAFAAGVPVIAFAAGGIPEMVQHGRKGFLCRTAAEMAEFAIELLSREPSRYQAVAQAAREAWRIRFTLERWQQQVAAEMERCAAGVQCAASAATVSA